MTIVTVLRSGGCYTEEWVHRLRRQVAAHIPHHRFVCLTDLPLHPDIETIALEHSWPGWWSKLELFRPGLFTGRVLFFDLDTLVLAPFPLGLPADGPQLWMLSDFYVPKVPASAVMYWLPSAWTAGIFESFRATAYLNIKRPHGAVYRSGAYGDGGYIGNFGHQRLQDVLPGTFGSYKADNLRDGPRDFPVVCFHGTPKPHELPPDHWARMVWEGVAAV